MKGIYSITKGQFIVIWIFGAIGWFWALSNSDYSYSFSYEFLMWVIPFMLIFYTIGWRNKRKGAKPEPRYKSMVEILDEVDKNGD